MFLSKRTVSNIKYVNFSNLSTLYVDAIVTLMITYHRLKTVTFTFAPHPPFFPALTRFRTKSKKLPCTGGQLFIDEN
jgi:hypothetical protein